VAKISQREARALRKRVAELETQRDEKNRSWSSEWPEGRHIWNIGLSDTCREALKVARVLGHALVGTLDDKGLKVYAVKP
jgi:NADPH-dependent glutamate synthase beta subunit-like oxidoreductase